MPVRIVLCSLFGLLSAGPLQGQELFSAPDTLTAEQVMVRAWTHAPQVLEAETLEREARGRLIGARSWSNPELEAVTGKPEGAGRRTEAEMSLPMGFGLKRSRRVGAAMAELRTEEHQRRDIQHRAVGAALIAFYRTLHAELVLDVARRRLELAEELCTVARERVSSGDAAEIENYVSQVELSRARSAVFLERQELAAIRTELAFLLGLPSPSQLVVRGDLTDRSAYRMATDTLSLELRPDVLAAESRVEAAAEKRSLAGLAMVPDLSFRLKYETEGRSTTWMPGLALTLPVFDRGQGERVESQARLDRSRIERDRVLTTARVEHANARARYQAAVAAVHELESGGVSGSARVEEMAQESYRAGKTDLGSLLVLRREALETRREYIDRQLEAAIRGIELALATGQWPTMEAR